ncbi:MAG TPA: phosphoglycerate mutase, partial [bacterium]|nr:phosphoglycerate mutase [bacterium]
GDAKMKVQAIEDVDTRVLGRILEKLPKPYRILILPDHPTPVPLKTHSTDPVPFLIYDSSWSEARGSERFCERTAQSRGFWIKEGFRLMGQFLRMGTLRNAP